MGFKAYIGTEIEKAIQKANSPLSKAQYVRLAVLDKLDKDRPRQVAA